MSQGRFEFLAHGAPITWLHVGGEPVAAQSAPPDAPTPQHVRAVDSAIDAPVASRVDPLVAMIAGLVVALLVGLSWFGLEVEGSVTAPKVVALTGLLIGAAVRLGGGPSDPALRGAMALFLFLVTTLVVTFLIVRFQVHAFAAQGPHVADERAFVRYRILQPEHLRAVAGGTCSAIAVNYLWTRRR